MNKSARIGLIIALVASLALLALPGTVPLQAQGSFTITYDFTSSVYDWTAQTSGCSGGSLAGNYVGGTGWEGIFVNSGGCAGGNINQLKVLANWPTQAHVTSIDITYSIPLTVLNGVQDMFMAWDGNNASGSVTCDVTDTAVLAAGQSFTNRTVTLTQDCPSSRSWQYWVNSNNTAGPQILSKIVLHGTGSSPFTPTPTSTPTITPTPGPVGTLPPAANYDSCPLLGDSNANMTDTSKWRFNLNAFNGPGGVDITDGYIDQLLTLSRYNKYIITLKFKQSVADSNQAIIFSLGKTPGITVPLNAVTTEQTYVSPAANYEPTTLGAADNFDFLIGIAAVNPGNSLILTYACISDENATNPLGPGGSGAGALSSTCLSCTYQPGTINGLGDIINNIVKLLEWLWCGISQIWDCSVRPFFATLLAVIAIIISAIAFIRQWAAIILGNGNDWLGIVIPILAHWVAGFIINIIQAVLNAAATLAQSLGLGGLFAFIVGLINALPNIFNLVVAWVQLAIQQILLVLSAIPTLFISIITGFNHAAESTGATAPVCNDTSSPLYGPCLGLYVLDNTIFAGPIFYAVPLALGLLAFNTLLWAMQEVRGALTK